MADNQERYLRSIAGSLQEIAQASVQINNRLVEIGRILKSEEEQSPDGD